MLADIIIKSGETQTAWAKRIGVSKSYLSALLAGKKQPGLAVAVTIERETGGAVTPASWVPELAPVQPAPVQPAETPDEQDAAA